MAKKGKRDHAKPSSASRPAASSTVSKGAPNIRGGAASSTAAASPSSSSASSAAQGRERPTVFRNWTGKTPVVLLRDESSLQRLQSEWCQKNRYHKPNFHQCRGVRDGVFVSQPPSDARGEEGSDGEERDEEHEPISGPRVETHMVLLPKSLQTAAPRTKKSKKSKKVEEAVTHVGLHLTRSGPSHRFRITLNAKESREKEKLELRKHVESRWAAPTSQEAKHVAAICMLHHLNPDLPMYRVLPPDFRVLWHALTNEHQEREKRDAIRAEKTAVREEREKRREKQERKRIESTMEVYLSTRAANAIRSVLNPKRYAATSAATLPAERKAAVLSVLKKIGFDDASAQKALKGTPITSSMTVAQTVELCVEWLCVTTPDEALPVQLKDGKRNFEVSAAPETLNSSGGTSVEDKEEDVDDTPELCALMCDVSECIKGTTEEIRRVAMFLQHCANADDCGKSNDSIDSDAVLALQHAAEESNEAIFGEDFAVSRKCLRLGTTKLELNEWRVRIARDSGEDVVLFLLFALHSHGEKNTASLLENAPEESWEALDEDDKECDDTCPARLVLGSLSLTPSSQCVCCYPEISPAVSIEVPWPKHVRNHLMERLRECCRGCRGEDVLFNLVSLVQEYDPSQAPRSSGPSSAATPFADNEISVGEQHPEGRGKRRGARRGPTQGRKVTPPNWFATYLKRIERETWKERIKVRSRLPIAVFEDKIVRTVANNRVVVLTGATGSGKSTQVPQFLLKWAAVEHHPNCNIIVTQPRRISAISLAERVSWEQGEESPGGTVGYAVRLESRLGESTRLMYCTTGVLLRRVQSDPLLDDVTMIIVDEVHERTVDGDFLLLQLREIMRRNKNLRLMLMSATANAELFSSYFANAPIVSVPGRTFPVQKMYLEDVFEQLIRTRGREVCPIVPSALQSQYEKCRAVLPSKYSNACALCLAQHNHTAVPSALIAELVEYIGSTLQAGETAGGVLVFLPGMKEIISVRDALNGVRAHNAEGSSLDVLALPLHSSVSSADQKKVFSRCPAGSLKVVLSTNIAETSVTIDDIRYVIDTGTHNQMQFNSETKTQALVQCSISKASAEQRAGRAGRVQEGFAFRLYTSGHFNRMPAHEVPEIKRTPIFQLCLQAHALLQKISEKRSEGGRARGSSAASKTPTAAQFLSRAIEPPSRQDIEQAERYLADIGALKRDEQRLSLSALGWHLVELPLDVNLGKLLIVGSVLGVAEEALTIAAFLSSASPFQAPMDKRDEANACHKQFNMGKSDHFRCIAVFHGFMEAGRASEQRAFCREYFLSYATMCTIRDVRKQLRGLLWDIGFGSPVRGDAFRELCLSHHVRHLLPHRSGAAPQLGVKDKIAYGNLLKILSAVVCAGLYPNIVRIEPPEKLYTHVSQGTVAKATDPTQVRFWDYSRQRVKIHPASVNKTHGDFESLWLAYHQKVKTSQVFVRDSTMVYPYGLLLFGGELELHHDTGVITVGGWINFRATVRTGSLIRALRKELDEMLEQKISDPSLPVEDHPSVQVLRRILESEGIV